ncbi:cyclohexanone monooxygenase domain protein [Mycobacterium xenopi 3993]|nr:cyclohexanone monooxygenase domain protein [Mycobacterium xenopi 3993]
MAGRTRRRRDAHHTISDHRNRLFVSAAHPDIPESPASTARSSTPPPGTTVTTLRVGVSV